MRSELIQHYSYQYSVFELFWVSCGTERDYSFQRALEQCWLYTRAEVRKTSPASQCRLDEVNRIFKMSSDSWLEKSGSLLQEIAE